MGGIKMSAITYTYCPICREYIDENGTHIPAPWPGSETYEDHGYEFCPACISDAKDVMFETGEPLSECILNLITVDAFCNDRDVIAATKKEEERYNKGTNNLFEKLGEIMKPVSYEQFAGIIH